MRSSSEYGVAIEPKPASASTQWTAWVGFSGLAVAFVFLGGDFANSIERSALYFIICALIPMLTVELMVFKTYREKSSGLDFGKPRALSVKRILIKFVGILGTLSVIAFAYLNIPGYKESPFFSPFKAFLSQVWIAGLVGVLLYFPWIDRQMEEPEDGFFHAGCFFLAQWKKVRWPLFFQFARGWIVKGFFTPIMLGYFVNLLERVLRNPWDFSRFSAFYPRAIDAIFLVDLCFAVIGYIWTMRLFDSHIRSAEPTFLGWAVAIICYTPFQENVIERYLGYEDNFFWGNWLSQNSIPYILWGSTILFLNFIYVWSTFSFGLRFSNLTHRGIITSGPYRWSKHPAYLSKNLSWWLISIPFISNLGVWTAISNCLILAALNVIYVLRAKTEERHLSQDPDYARYVFWMQKNGLFALLTRSFRFVAGIKN